MQPGLGALSARYHRAFNERDFEVWREVLDEDVELDVDGMTFRGVDAAVAYGVGSRRSRRRSGGSSAPTRRRCCASRPTTP